VNSRVSNKEVKIENRNYQLNKPDARTACYLFSFLGAKINENENFFTGLGRCTRAEFNEIQSLALGKIFRMDQKEDSIFPVAIFLNGRITDQDLENNADELMKLTSEWLVFAFDPFMVASGLNSQK
jgi:hypothetical protein